MQTLLQQQKYFVHWKFRQHCIQQKRIKIGEYATSIILFKTKIKRDIIG